MPLGFHSLSHGTVPFGFFNVASDMILLRDHFAFASDFCGWMTEWAATDGPLREERPFWVFDDPRNIGNLHGAMAGVDLSGLIGGSYARYAFPEDPADFRQDPEGHRTRPHMERLAHEHAGPPRAVAVVIEPETLTFGVGPYRFDAPGLHGLVRYLWLGGAPRWRDGRPPAYVEVMMTAVRASHSPLFTGLAAAP